MCLTARTFTATKRNAKSESAETPSWKKRLRYAAAEKPKKTSNTVTCPRATARSTNWQTRAAERRPKGGRKEAERIKALIEAMIQEAKPPYDGD